jgi:hypothetical protein
VKTYRSRLQRRMVLASVALMLGLPLSVSAQAGGDGFLFKRPTASFGIRGGYALALAGSDVFDFASEHLTVDKSDFSSSAWGAELSVRATERLDIAAGVGLTYTSTSSEFRDWVDGDDLAIEQTTEFTRVPVTLSAKWYLRDRGRSVSSFVWIPERLTPYVGAGGGVVWSRFVQKGDFVDFETLDVFPSALESEGTTGTVHLFSGIDVSLGTKLLLTGEGRYSWGKMTMGQDFEDFNSIDLSGFQATVGLSLRF